MTPHSTLSGRNLKSADTPRDPLVLELSSLPALNLALQQNRHPIIQSLKLTNLSDRDFRALTCTISANPEIFPETVLQISSVEAGESIVPVIPDILPNYDFLSKISDTVAGTLNVKVSTEDEGLILSRDFPVAAYAPDQWLGSDSMPELLAAFVTPNQSRSAELKTEIRTLLAQELEQRRLWTPLSEEELQRRLKDLYRQGKTDLEESGVNTLFLGIGFLERKDSSADSVSRRKQRRNARCPLRIRRKRNLRPPQETNEQKRSGTTRPTHF